MWGVFTAGLDAGKIYNTFPLMNGHLLPPEAQDLKPLWRNLFENPALVQFVHRVLTITTALLLFTLALRLHRFTMDKAGRRVALALGIFSVLQPALGIATLLTGVNIPLAALHQAGALLLLSAAIAALMLLRKNQG